MTMLWFRMTDEILFIAQHIVTVAKLQVGGGGVELKEVKFSQRESGRGCLFSEL